MSNTIGNLSNVYNFYMTTYAPKSSSPYDSHKKSELRRVYNSIVKMNKESPLFILDTSRSSQQFAISVKENARELRNTIASLGGLDEEELLNKKVAFSSNEEIATASYIGSAGQNADAPSYDIEVDRLATPQVNMGKFLPADEPVALAPDTYSFDVRIEDLNYEFQFGIRPTDTNRTVQARLARLITNSNIGITASAFTDEDGSSYLRMESNTTGVKNGNSRIFHISDNRTSKTSGAVEYFGLDYISTPPSNASFLVNGEPRSSASNRIALDRIYEVQLTGVSGEDGCGFPGRECQHAGKRLQYFSQCRLRIQGRTAQEQPSLQRDERCGKSLRQRPYQRRPEPESGRQTGSGRRYAARDRHERRCKRGIPAYEEFHKLCPAQVQPVGS